MRRPAFWYAAALTGVILVLVGLSVDAWRHSAGDAAEESLLSLGNPGHLIAAIGLGITAVSALAGLTLAWWELAGWPQPEAKDLLRRLAVPAFAWVGTGAIAVAAIGYIASSDVTVGHGGHEAGTVVAAPEAGAGAIPAAVEPASGDHTHDTAAGDSHEAHDVGAHATFDQFMTMGDTELVSLAPAGTLNAADVPALREQLRQVRAVAEKYADVDAAIADGYYNTTHDVPFMGAHFLNSEYLGDGLFDPSKPEGLLYSRLGDSDGPWQLVGVWFLQLPGSGGATLETQPEGFAGGLDLWHGHKGLCTTGGDLQIREDATAEECAAEGGSYISDLRWMMHAWVVPDVAPNKDGVFAYLNSDLFALQARGGSAEGGEVAN